MFPIFKNFVLYFSILSYTYAPPTKSDEIPKLATPFDEKQIQREIAHFAKFWSMIPNSEDRGELKGQLRMLIIRSIKADALLEERGILQQKNNDSLHKVKVLEVPLVFRNYVNRIEDMFPSIKATIPANVMRNEKFHQGVLQRKYNWIEILSKEECSKNVYVQLLRTALKNEFFSREKIAIEKEIQDLTDQEKAKYDEFLTIFCKGIAVSVEYVNNIIAHNEFGRYPGNDLLNVFERAYYDKYVSLFYHAIVGTTE